MSLFNRLLPTLLAGFLACSSLSASAARSVRVALYADEGAGRRGIENVERQLKAAGHTVVRFTGEEIAGGALRNGFDAVAFTGGSGSRQGRALGEEGREEVRQFVRNGGGYLGICAGAYLACSGYTEWGVGVLNARRISPRWRRGRAELKVEINEAGAEVTGLPVGVHKIRYANGPVFGPHAGNNDIPPYEVLGTFIEEVAENDTPAGIQIGAPAFARGTYGKGRVVVSSPHPESTPGLSDVFAASAVAWLTAPRD